MNTSTRSRKLVKERAGNRCEHCGIAGTDWHYQHRRARGMGGSTDLMSDSPANGMQLLPRCHLEEVEANPTRALKMGWRIPQRADPTLVPVKMWDGWFLLQHDGSKVAYDEG